MPIIQSMRCAPTFGGRLRTAFGYVRRALVAVSLAISGFVAEDRCRIWHPAAGASTKHVFLMSGLVVGATARACPDPLCPLVDRLGRQGFAYPC
jgi:hypothetical protein